MVQTFGQLHEASVKKRKVKLPLYLFDNTLQSDTQAGDLTLT